MVSTSNKSIPESWPLMNVALVSKVSINLAS